MVVCLERGADLHVAQLMPLPLTVSCSSKIQIGFTFLITAYPGCPEKQAVKWLLLLLLSLLFPLCKLRLCFGRYFGLVNTRLQMTHGSEWDVEIWRTQGWKCHTRVQPECDIFNGRHNFHVPHSRVSYVLSYGQLQESWIISGLQWWNVNEYRLPSKNAHSPNYCSWLAVCVNYSANFYCS